MGSQTPTSIITKQKQVLEINSPEACRLSGDKILMKTRFTRAKIPTAKWFIINPNDVDHEKIKYYLKQWNTLIIKHKHSSKGNGIYLIKNIEDYFASKVNKVLYDAGHTESREFLVDGQSITDLIIPETIDTISDFLFYN